MNMNQSQTAAIQLLREALANPQPQTKAFDTYAGHAVKHIRVTGINGNVLNALVKMKAIKVSSHLGCAAGGHWLAGLEVLAPAHPQLPPS